jgi:predicted component of type VI protein secretion system
MKSYSKIAMTVVALGILSLQAASADDSGRLKTFFDERLSGFEKRLCSMEEKSDSTLFPAMTLSDVNIQVEATASFGIESVLHLSISPEVDFIVTPAVAPMVE